MHPHLADADTLDRIHRAARTQAAQLRAQAMDDFWRGGNALLASTLDSAARSARRWAQRLQRHQQLRAQPERPTTPSTTGA
ncbi:MAG: hypothetical protein ACT4NV_15225 [Rhodoferax sp.]